MKGDKFRNILDKESNFRRTLYDCGAIYGMYTSLLDRKNRLLLSINEVKLLSGFISLRFNSCFQEIG